MFLDTSNAGTLSVFSASIQQSWMGPLIGLLEDEFDITTSTSSWLVSSLAFGSIAGTIPTALLADRYGRKYVLFSCGPIGLTALAMTIMSQSVYVLYIVRFIQGFVTSSTFSIVPLYIAEISDPKVRGFLAGQFQIMWNLGLLFMYSTGPFMKFQQYIIVCGIVPFLFTICFIIAPESPYYLLIAKDEEKAKQSLKWLRGTDFTDEEFSSIKMSVTKDMENKSSWNDLFSTSKDRKIFITVQLVCITKCMSGAPALSIYAADIFSRASNGLLNKNTAAIIYGLILTLSALVGAAMSDVIGRRSLLITTSLLIAVFYAITAVYFFLIENTDIKMDDESWILYSTVGISAILSNIGPAALLQTIQGEMFPSHTRAMGNALTGVTAAIIVFIDLKQYSTLIHLFGEYMNFAIFSFFSLLGGVLLSFVLNETAMKSLGEIQNEMEMPIQIL